MVLDSSNLMIENGGLDTDFEMYTYINGGMMVDSPGGDFFRMPASEPTMSVSVDGFFASCAAPDCSFSHDSSLTPSPSEYVLMPIIHCYRFLFVYTTYSLIKVFFVEIF